MPLAGTVDPADGGADAVYLLIESFAVVALQRHAGQLPAAAVPAPAAGPDERLDPVPGVGRDADRLASSAASSARRWALAQRLLDRRVRARSWPPSRCCSRRSISDARPAARARPAQLSRVQRLFDARRVVVLHPGDARVLAEPAVLPPREPPRAGEGPLPRLLLGDLPVEEGERSAGSRWPGSPYAPRAGPAPSSARTSSTKPVGHISSTRWWIRRSRVSRSMSTPICTACS